MGLSRTATGELRQKTGITHKEIEGVIDKATRYDGCTCPMCIRSSILLPLREKIRVVVFEPKRRFIVCPTLSDEQFDLFNLKKPSTEEMLAKFVGCSTNQARELIRLGLRAAEAEERWSDKHKYPAGFETATNDVRDYANTLNSKMFIYFGMIGRKPKKSKVRISDISKSFVFRTKEFIDES